MLSATALGTKVTSGPLLPRNSIRGASGAKVWAIWRVLRKLWSSTSGTSEMGGAPKRGKIRWRSSV